MSDPKATAPPEAYYASGSYQQGGTPAAVSTANDQEYAQRLQNEEFRNAQQQQQHHQVRDLAWLGLAWRGVACLAREVVCVLTLGVCVDAVCILYAQHVPRGTVLPTVTGQIIRPGDGMQYVPMYPPANAFDPADLGTGFGWVGIEVSLIAYSCP
eukprot:jgi/Undpi1/5350/HiC_scaffold_2.g00631.m1